MQYFFEALFNRLVPFTKIIQTKEDECILEEFNPDIEEIVKQCCQEYQMYYSVEQEIQFRCTFWYNACLICRDNLGFLNPRQLCHKWYCPQQFHVGLNQQI